MQQSEQIEKLIRIMHDIVVIKQILQDIKERMILSEISEWTNSTYSEISEAVFAKTGVLLSRNTLKNMVAKVLENRITSYNVCYTKLLRRVALVRHTLSNPTLPDPAHS